MPNLQLFSVTIRNNEVSFFGFIWKRFLIEKYYHLIMEHCMLSLYLIISHVSFIFLMIILCLIGLRVKKQ